MLSERDVRLDDGRTLRVYDTDPDAAEAFAVLWHHGSPQTGAPLEPLLSAAAERAIRLLSYGRPSYGGSSPRPGRDVASVAADVARIADAFGIARFAVMGASGGGPHALACAALLPNRVTAVACLAGIAPVTEEFDWFDGMASPGGLRAAIAGRVSSTTVVSTGPGLRPAARTMPAPSSRKVSTSGGVYDGNDHQVRKNARVREGSLHEPRPLALRRLNRGPGHF